MNVEFDEFLRQLLEFIRKRHVSRKPLNSRAAVKMPPKSVFVIASLVSAGLQVNHKRGDIRRRNPAYP